MNIKVSEMRIDKEKRDISFLIKIINNLLEKYKNMKVLDKTRDDFVTCFNLKDDDFDVTLTYNSFVRTLDIKICGVENYSFRDDLERELKEFALFN